MRVEMFVSPRTLANLEGARTLFYSIDKESYPIHLVQDTNAQDWEGHLMVNGNYVGSYKLNEAQEKKRIFK